MCKYYLPQATEEYYEKPQQWQVVSLTSHKFQIQTRALPLTSPFSSQHDLLYCIGVSIPNTKLVYVPMFDTHCHHESESPVNLWCTCSHASSVQLRCYPHWHPGIPYDMALWTHTNHTSQVLTKDLWMVHKWCSHMRQGNHICLSMSCQLIHEFQWGKTHGTVADFFFVQYNP